LQSTQQISNLITEDRWGGSTTTVSFWGAAPVEKIIEFMLSSYHLLYPDYVFNWMMMVETMGQENAPVAVIQNLLDVQHALSPGYNID
jgi:hypothetical protein